MKDNDKTLEESLNDLKNAINEAIEPVIIWIEKILIWSTHKIENLKAMIK